MIFLFILSAVQRLVILDPKCFRKLKDNVISIIYSAKEIREKRVLGTIFNISNFMKSKNNSEYAVFTRHVSHRSVWKFV